MYDPRQDPKYKDDALFLALLNRESRFNPNAVSPTGARGYAQLLKSTTSDPGFGVRANPNAVSDPKQNVDFGREYLSAMQKRYNGDDAAALVAYNGGPGAADRWVSSGKNDKVISPESRAYYKAILGSVGQDFSKINAGVMPSGKIDVKAPSDSTETKIGGSTVSGAPVSQDTARKPKLKPIEVASEEPDKWSVELAKPKSNKVRLDNYENTFRFRPQMARSDLDNPLER